MSVPAYLASRRDIVLGLAAAILVPFRASAAPRVRAFAVRGLAGAMFSSGMATLADELNKVPGVECTVESHGIAYCENAVAIAVSAKAAAKKNERIVLIGHSFGGDCAVRVAAALLEHKIPVALLVAVDASWFSCPPVPANVATAISYYQDNGLIGRLRLARGPGFHGRLIEKHYNGGHLEIDKSPMVQNSIVAETRRIAGLSGYDPKILPPDAQQPMPVSINN